ncbi:hypothetical protein H696_00348 [Fonticula alba]|uniref:GCF C-terminal domain-containing protein n=1 Tax=Fonticula alba TaxID=691883 RepID=A0A058ZEH2_FONAL|nr:hypothetical protein H696_00348 [Fonticula alba]KCV72769.1 hypothetical protein H696_00348 [Fonticula alba]|eukprot:XP_009492470.1 hypothetical protein H696_00348 [Fonticula alba]
MSFSSTRASQARRMAERRRPLALEPDDPEEGDTSMGTSLPSISSAVTTDTGAATAGSSPPTERASLFRSRGSRTRAAPRPALADLDPDADPSDVGVAAPPPRSRVARSRPAAPAAKLSFGEEEGEEDFVPGPGPRTGPGGTDTGPLWRRSGGTSSVQSGRGPSRFSGSLGAGRSRGGSLVNPRVTEGPAAGQGPTLVGPSRDYSAAALAQLKASTPSLFLAGESRPEIVSVLEDEDEGEAGSMADGPASGVTPIYVPDEATIRAWKEESLARQEAQARARLAARRQARSHGGLHSDDDTDDDGPGGDRYRSPAPDFIPLSRRRGGAGSDYDAMEVDVADVGPPGGSEAAGRRRRPRQDDPDGEVDLLEEEFTSGRSGGDHAAARRSQLLVDMRRSMAPPGAGARADAGPDSPAAMVADVAEEDDDDEEATLSQWEAELVTRGVRARAVFVDAAGQVARVGSHADMQGPTDASLLARARRDLASQRRTVLPGSDRAPVDVVFLNESSSTSSLHRAFSSDGPLEAPDLPTAPSLRNVTLRLEHLASRMAAQTETNDRRLAEAERQIEQDEAQITLGGEKLQTARSRYLFHQGLRRYLDDLGDRMAALREPLERAEREAADALARDLVEQRQQQQPADGGDPTAAWPRWQAVAARAGPQLLRNVPAEFADVRLLGVRLEAWRSQSPESYEAAYARESLDRLFAPLVRVALLRWNPLDTTGEWARLAAAAAAATAVEDEEPAPGAAVIAAAADAMEVDPIEAGTQSVARAPDGASAPGNSFRLLPDLAAVLDLPVFREGGSAHREPGAVPAALPLSPAGGRLIGQTVVPRLTALITGGVDIPAAELERCIERLLVPELERAGAPAVASTYAELMSALESRLYA